MNDGRVKVTGKPSKYFSLKHAGNQLASLSVGTQNSPLGLEFARWYVGSDFFSGSEILVSIVCSVFLIISNPT